MAECEDLREIEGEEEEETRGSKEHNGGSDSSDEDSSEAPLAAQDVDDGSEDSSSCSGPAVREEEGKTEEDTDSEEDNGHHGPRHSDTEEEDERAGAEEDGKGQGFTHNGEPEFKPKKHNLATTVDKEKVLAAYIDVMSDQKADINWAFFNYTDSTIGVKATGKEFSDFKTHFTPDDRGFGYIKITTGDELSKRSKFVFCTWIGPNVSVMKKAKMGTDKAFVKEVIQNISVELQPESLSEVDASYFETECRKAGGANYGTGKRD